MANEFTKLTEKEVVESVSENGHLFAEDGGKIVRIPAAGVGGGGPIVFTAVDIDNGQFTCNATYEEVRSRLRNSVVYLIDQESESSGYINYLGFWADRYEERVPCIEMEFYTSDNGIHLYYTADGTLTMSDPNGK